MESYEKELRDLRERMAQLHSDRSVLEALRGQEQACLEEMERRRARRDKEQADVDRLERLTLSSIFHTLAGSKEDKLSQEQAEAYAAALKFQAAQRQLEEVRREIEFRRQRLQENEGAPEEYDRLLHRKAEELKESDPAAAERLGKIEERIAALMARRRELQEAVDAGEAVRDRLRAVEDSLSSAEGWSTWDLLGGGLLADAAKYSHLDEAEKRSDELQSDLRRYQAELSDVTISADFHIRVDGFLSMADVWWDNIFTDWAVRDHIGQAIGRVRETQAQVDALQEALRADLSAAERELEEQQARWRAAAEQA